MTSSPLYARYAQAVDRDSVYERLTAEQQAAEAGRRAPRLAEDGNDRLAGAEPWRNRRRSPPPRPTARRRRIRRGAPEG
ncbi:hypothetical protein [Streptomyces sp. FIT100]|uniref:hypothetical protein n=1 Tax=Streptomyces sp. FIT100 TaxID=2837956 RepID=UPI0037DA0BF9